jgi:hypothetical protein
LVQHLFNSRYTPAQVASDVRSPKPDDLPSARGENLICLLIAENVIAYLLYPKLFSLSVKHPFKSFRPFLGYDSSVPEVTVHEYGKTLSWKCDIRATGNSAVVLSESQSPFMQFRS